jgi:hypothetical protein
MPGIDILPESIRNSKILSQKDLALLAGVHELPLINPSFNDHHLKQIIQYYSLNPDEMEQELHYYAKRLLEEGKTDEAWQVLLAG